jgi:hypothetical protein
MKRKREEKREERRGREESLNGNKAYTHTHTCSKM